MSEAKGKALHSYSIGFSLSSPYLLSFQIHGAENLSEDQLLLDFERIKAGILEEHAKVRGLFALEVGRPVVNNGCGEASHE